MNLKRRETGLGNDASINTNTLNILLLSVLFYRLEDQWVVCDSRRCRKWRLVSEDSKKFVLRKFYCGNEDRTNLEVIPQTLTTAIITITTTIVQQQQQPKQQKLH